MLYSVTRALTRCPKLAMTRFDASLRDNHGIGAAFSIFKLLWFSRFRASLNVVDLAEEHFIIFQKERRHQHELATLILWKRIRANL